MTTKRPLQRFVLTLGLVTGLLSLPARPAPAKEYADPLAFKMLDRGIYHLAVLRFSRLIVEQPGVAGPHAGMALTRCRMGQPERALPELAIARQRGPDEPLVFATDACLAELDGDLAAAMLHWEDAGAASGQAFFSVTRVRMLLDRGEVGAAEDLLEELELGGWDGMAAIALRAECRLVDGDVEGAIQLMTLLEMKRPRISATQPVATLVDLASSHLNPAAFEPFPRFVGWGPAGRAVVFRAEAMRRLGLLDAAEAEANRRKDDPDDPVSCAMLARLAHDLGDTDAAWDWLEVAGQRWPAHPSVVLTEALLLAREGRPQAVDVLREARALGVPPWERSVEQEVEARLPEGRLPARPVRTDAILRR